MNKTDSLNQVATVTITPAAEREIQSIRTSDPETNGKSLRLYVEGGCCSGMSYGMAFDDQQSDDVIQQCDGFSILMDPDSLEHLHGAIIDYGAGPEGSGFRISNPKSCQGCDCGHAYET